MNLNEHIDSFVTKPLKDRTGSVAQHLERHYYPPEGFKHEVYGHGHTGEGLIVAGHYHNKDTEISYGTRILKPEHVGKDELDLMTGHHWAEGKAPETVHWAHISTPDPPNRTQDEAGHDAYLPAISHGHAREMAVAMKRDLDSGMHPDKVLDKFTRGKHHGCFNDRCDGFGPVPQEKVPQRSHSGFADLASHEAFVKEDIAELVVMTMLEYGSILEARVRYVPNKALYKGKNPKFFHTHYVAVAGEIAKRVQTTHPKILSHVTNAFIDTFSQDNPRFNPQRFRAAASGQPALPSDFPQWGAKRVKFGEPHVRQLAMKTAEHSLRTRKVVGKHVADIVGAAMPGFDHRHFTKSLMGGQVSARLGTVAKDPKIPSPKQWDF